MPTAVCICTFVAWRAEVDDDGGESGALVRKRKLSGLRSRWQMGGSSVWQYSTAETTCRTSSAASCSQYRPSGVRVFSMMRSKSSPPAHSSVTMYTFSSASNTSTTSMMCGCATRRSTAISVSSRSGRCTLARLIALIAKASPVARRVHLYTTPK